MDDEIVKKIRYITELIHKVAFENGDMQELLSEMEKLIGKEHMASELKKRTVPKVKYTNFSYSLILLDILREWGR